MKTRSSKALLALLAIAPAMVHAQTTHSWRSEAANGTWELADNWWDGVQTALPGGSEILSFGNNAQTTMTNDLVATTRHRILFGTGATTVRTIGGSTENAFVAVSENGALIQNNSTAAHILNFPISIGSDGLAVDTASGALNLNGAISGSGTIAKTSGGVVSAGWDGTGVHNLVISGDNSSFTGKWTVTGGSLSINSDAALGAVPGSFVADAITLNGGALANMSAASGSGFGAGHDLALHANRGITLGANGGNIRIGYSRTVTINGAITGSGLLRRTDGGTLILNGVNTYGGITHLRAGTTRTGVSGALPSTTNVLLWGGSTLDLDGTTQSIAGIHVGGAGDTNTTLQMGTGGNLTVTGNAMPGGSPANAGGDMHARIRGTGSITYDNSAAPQGSWTWFNTNNDYQGAITVTNGRLRFTDVTLGHASNGIVFNGDIVSTLGSGQGKASIQQTSGASVSYAATRTFTINTGKEGTFYAWGGQTMTIEGQITGGGNLRKEDGGILLLNNTTNNYGGMTRIAAGTLRVGSAAALPSATTLEIAGGNFDLTTQTITVATLIGSGGAVNGGGTLTVNTAGSSIYSGQIQNSTTLHMAGTGTQTLSGTADNNSGWARVSSGTLVLAKSGASTSRSVGRSNGDVALTITGGTARLDGGHTDQIYGDSSVEMTGGVFDLNGRNESFRGLIGSGGTIRNDAADTTSVLTLGEIINAGEADYTYSGTIADGSGFVELTKTGTGIQTLSGTCTHTGTTTIQQGTLRIETNVGSSPVTVLSGGTLALGSTSPAYASSDLVLLSGSAFSTQIDSDTSTTNRLDVTGEVDLGDASLSLVDTGSTTLALGTKLTLITYTGSLLGTFAGLNEGANLTLGANTFSIAYNDSGAVTLTAVAPSGYATWAETHAPGQSPGEDFDGDGVANAIEWILGGTKDTNDTDKLPAASTTATEFIFTFIRAKESDTSGTSVRIEVGTTLDSWPQSYDVPSAPEVSVVPIDDDFETVTLTLGRAPDDRKFARLVVEID